MPLPISSQVYIHNPLTEARATEIGKKVGSPFANFAEGLLAGTERGVDVASKIQQMELAPLEEDRKNRAAELAEQKADLAQVKEDRLAANQEFEHKDKTRQTDIKAKQVIINRDKADSQINKTDAATSLAMQNQSRSNIVEGSVNSLISNGNPGPIAAQVMSGGKGRTDIRDYLIKPANAGVAQATVDRLQDAMIDGRLNREEAMAVNSFIGTLDHSKNIESAREVALRERPAWESLIGSSPDKQNEVIREKTGDGGNDWKFWEIIRDEDGRRIKKNLLGIYTNDGDFKKINALDKVMNAHNKLWKMEQGVKEAVRASAKKQAALTALPVQEERPAKLKPNLRTPTTRAGANNPTPARRRFSTSSVGQASTVTTGSRPTTTTTPVSPSINTVTPAVDTTTTTVSADGEAVRTETNDEARTRQAQENLRGLTQ